MPVKCKHARFSVKNLVAIVTTLALFSTSIHLYIHINAKVSPDSSPYPHLPQILEERTGGKKQQLLYYIH